MTAKLRPYSSTRDSGIQWLGKLPSHWEVLPNRALFEEIRERNHPDATVLSVTIEKGVILQNALLQERSRKDSSSIDKSAYKFVRSGDLAYNKMRAWQGAVGKSDHSGIISPAYVVQRPRKGLARYFHYLLRIPAFAKEAERWSYGITSDMWSLRPEHFKMIYTCYPPLSEQFGIVRFLDHLSANISNCICAKHKLIELLGELRQSIIHHAVTRGLDPTVRLKPFGSHKSVEVPEHWDLRPIKHWVTINAEVLPESTNPDYVFSYIDIGSVGTGRMVERPQQIRFSKAPSRARRIVHSGDTLVSTVRTYLKAVYFVDGEFDQDGLVCSTGFAVLTPRFGTVARFVSYLFQSNALTDRVMAESVGIAYPAIAESRLGSLVVAIPSYSEQLAIVSFLDRSTDSIDTIISSIQNEVSLLREYQRRLVSDVVTGKLDAREVAKRVPVELGTSSNPDTV